MVLEVFYNGDYYRANAPLDIELIIEKDPFSLIIKYQRSPFSCRTPIKFSSSLSLIEISGQNYYDHANKFGFEIGKNIISIWFDQSHLNLPKYTPQTQIQDLVI